MVVTKRSDILKQTCRFVEVSVTFLLPPDTKGLKLKGHMTGKIQHLVFRGFYRHWQFFILGVSLCSWLLSLSVFKFF